jgi:ATP-dependent RNA helicase SUPV3L1/SUV3
LRKYGVRFGAYHLYLPALLKPAPRVLALHLWALKQNAVELKGLDELPALAVSGRTSLKVDPEIGKGLYRTIGYRVCGERAVRVDILERLADAIRPALAWRPNAPGEKPPGAVDGSSFTVTGAMTSLVGSSGEDFASVLKSLGYRMERRPKPPEPAPKPSERDEVSPVALGTAPVTPEGADPAGEITQAPPLAEEASGALAEAVPAEPATREQAASNEAAPPDPVPVDVAPTTGTDTIALGVAPIAPEAVPDEFHKPFGDPVAPAAEAQPAAAEGAEEQTAPAAESGANAGAPATSPADASAGEQARVEEVMIEVWRPGRFEERRPRPVRPPRERTRDRPGHRRPQVQPLAATATPAEGAPAATAEAAAAPVSAPPPRHWEKPQRSKEERERTPKAFSKGQDRQKSDDRRSGDRPRPARKRREVEGSQDWKEHVQQRERRDKGPDPNSPFAKLLALKEQLEADAKERR